MDTITHVSSFLMFLNNIMINLTEGDFACSTSCHITMTKAAAEIKTHDSELQGQEEVRRTSEFALQ